MQDWTAPFHAKEARAILAAATASATKGLLVTDRAPASVIQLEDFGLDKTARNVLQTTLERSATLFVLDCLARQPWLASVTGTADATQEASACARLVLEINQTALIATTLISAVHVAPLVTGL